MRQPPFCPPGGVPPPPGLVGGVGFTRVKGASAPQPENNDAARTAAIQSFIHARIVFPLNIIRSLYPPPHPLRPVTGGGEEGGDILFNPSNASTSRRAFG